MKKSRRYAAGRPAPRRRWHIPPPLIHGSDTLEGGSILQEWPSALGVVLWQGFRDVMLWATTEPEARGGIFAGRQARWQGIEGLLDGQVDVRLHGALRVIDEMVASPATVRDEQVARACQQLSEWAYEQAKLHTALAFAQDAALATPSSASAAFWVATIAGRLNDHPRAEGWFRRAVGLARRSRDWRMYSRAFSGLGNLYIRRGNLPAARRLHTRALRGARRGGMRREQASALHDLFVVATETGNVAEAERLARQALEACGTRNPRIHVLAHDVAYFWMEQGNFRRALSVFQAVLPLMEKRLERLFVLADIVRAAGGVGDAATALSAAEEVDRLLAEPELRIGTGRALLDVARGFLHLGDEERAEDAARRALTGAIEFRENKVRFAAEALLASIHEKAVEVPAATRRTRGPVADPRSGDQLAADFVRTLEGIAGAAT